MAYPSQIVLMEEKELIRQLSEGKEEVFEIVFRKYFSGLCLYAEHFVRDTKVVEEIVEVFFCDLWENSKNLSIDSSLNGYLYRSIHNRCLKYIRHKNVEQKYVASQQYYFTDKEILEPASQDDPEANLIAKELEHEISDAIASLPRQCREIFSLNRFGNLTYTEIAHKLEISENTVKTQMSRALQKLRVRLKSYLTILLLFLLNVRILI